MIVLYGNKNHDAMNKNIYINSHSDYSQDLDSNLEMISSLLKLVVSNQQPRLRVNATSLSKHGCCLKSVCFLFPYSQVLSSAHYFLFLAMNLHLEDLWIFIQNILKTSLFMILNYFGFKNLIKV